MSKSDQWVNILLIIVIAIYLVVLIIAAAGNKGPLLITLLNLLSGLSLIIYWVWKQLRIQQHYFDLREILFLSFEIIVTCGAGYLLMSGNFNGRLRILSYTFFGIHFLCLVSFLIFMRTFKIKRLI